MSIKQKLESFLSNSLEKVVLPACHKVAVRHGFVGDLQDFSAEVLAEMKGEANNAVQPCCFVPQSGEEV